MSAGRSPDSASGSHGNMQLAGLPRSFASNFEGCGQCDGACHAPPEPTLWDCERQLYASGRRRRTAECSDKNAWVEPSSVAQWPPLFWKATLANLCSSSSETHDWTSSKMPIVANNCSSDMLVWSRSLRQEDDFTITIDMDAHLHDVKCIPMPKDRDDADQLTGRGGGRPAQAERLPRRRRQESTPRYRLRNDVVSATCCVPPGSRCAGASVRSAAGSSPPSSWRRPPPSATCPVEDPRPASSFLWQTAASSRASARHT